MNYSEILEQAADEIEKSGWTQHTLRNYKNEVCAWGAMLVAAGWNNRLCTSPEDRDRMDAAVGIAGHARKFVERHILYGNIADWNDSNERTKEEVLDLFRLAAKKARLIEEGIEN